MFSPDRSRSQLAIRLFVFKTIGSDSQVFSESLQLQESAELATSKRIVIYCWTSKVLFSYGRTLRKFKAKNGNSENIILTG